MTPLGVLGGMLGSTQMFVKSEMFAMYPTPVGWVIAIIFWLIVGGIIGWIIYKIRESHYSQKGQIVPSGVGTVVIFTILFQLVIGYSLGLAVVPFSKKEVAQREVEKQKYYDENCATIYTKKSNYKILECPGSIVADNASASIEYLSERDQINNN